MNGGNRGDGLPSIQESPENLVGAVNKGGIKLCEIGGLGLNDVRVEFGPLFYPLLQCSFYGPGRKVEEFLA